MIFENCIDVEGSTLVMNKLRNMGIFANAPEECEAHIFVNSEMLFTNAAIGNDDEKANRFIEQIIDKLKTSLSIRRKYMEKRELDNKRIKEKFINLCETSDFVSVDGQLGIYYKKEEIIMFPFPSDGMIKVRDYDYYEVGDEIWILPRNGEVGRYHVRFLNEVKN